jgi:ubiquinone/menaquinone biosynthesis C-methylase UbiE
MEATLPRRAQCYSWDLAAPDYEGLWHAQLARAQSKLMDSVSIRPGENVLDVACGTGMVTFNAAAAVGPTGHVVGTDISGEMVGIATQRALARGLSNVTFNRMEGETLTLFDGTFDVALCAFGFMYVPDSLRALTEIRRVLRRGGRVGVLVAEETTDQESNLAQLCLRAGLRPTIQHRVDRDLVVLAALAIS